MLWRTHFLAGAALGLAWASYAAEPATALKVAAVAGTAALLPDLDDPRSRLGRKVAPVSFAAKVVFGHRGALHSLLGVLGAFLLAKLAVPWAAVPVLLGYLSHLVVDSLNPAGIPWLWPVVRKHFGLPLVSTGSMAEKLLVFPVLVVLCGWLWLR